MISANVNLFRLPDSIIGTQAGLDIAQELKDVNPSTQVKLTLREGQTISATSLFHLFMSRFKDTEYSPRDVLTVYSPDESVRKELDAEYSRAFLRFKLHTGKINW